MSWLNIEVRNKDGRIGVIEGEYEGFLHLGLSITCADGTEDRVQLNVNGPDTGSVGWEWWCEHFDGGGRWLPLGDMNQEDGLP